MEVDLHSLKHYIPKIKPSIRLKQILYYSIWHWILLQMIKSWILLLYEENDLILRNLILNGKKLVQNFNWKICGTVKEKLM